MIDLSNKKKLTIAVSLYLALILGIVIISQYDAISGFISSTLSVLSPIIIGFALSYFLNPILKFFERKVFKKIRNKLTLRIVSLVCTFLSVVLFIIGFAMLIIPHVTESLTDLGNRWEEYQASMFAFIDKVILKLNELGMNTYSITSQEVIEYVKKIFASDNDLADTILSYIANNYKNILVIPRNILLAVFISIYVLLTKERISAQTRKFINAVFNKQKAQGISKRFKKTHATFGGYFTGVVLDAIFIGISSFILCCIFRIPYASLISVVLAITNVIPVFGPFIGTIPSAFIILLSEPSKVIIFVVLVIVLQQIDGNIVAPKILGESTGISSLGVIVAITIMGACFGFVGMLAGVPIFAVIVALIRELVDEKLKSKELSTDIADYYPKNSIVAPSKADGDSIWQIIAKKFSTIFSDIFKKKQK